MDNIALTKYCNSKFFQKRSNNYNPNENNIKFLVIMACHCDSEIKLSAIKRNLKYFDYECIDILLINTIGLSYNQQIIEECSKYNNIKYTETQNFSTYDFGKWIHALENVKYYTYDYIVFTNDSFIIHAPINHFFNLAHKYNVDFYGYNDSTQQQYHYQSYLFILKRNAIPLFIRNYNKKKHLIKNQNDVIEHYELKMTTWFKTRHCFLNIGEFTINKGMNIFFTNDALYGKLKEMTLLPFTKIKRII
jgi:hypothetical protein